MNIVYYSKNGKTQKLALSINEKAESIFEYSGQDCILFTPTYGKGNIPKPVKEFVESNSDKIKALVGNGSITGHKETFCFAVDKLSEMLNIPILMKVSLGGTQDEVNQLKDIVSKFDLEGCVCPQMCKVHPVECSCED